MQANAPTLFTSRQVSRRKWQIESPSGAVVGVARSRQASRQQREQRDHALVARVLDQLTLPA
jgi:hypothetical protein